MPAALEISSLKKTYANGFEALKGIDLNVEEGDFYALLGPNGAGKSTTIGIVSSLISKSGGNVRICGIDIDEDFSLAKKQIGIVPQEFNFNVFEKVEDVLIHQAGYYGIPIGIARERAMYYLEKLGIADKQHVQMRMLSGGMKRRLMIARALVHEPRVLILDEPTAGVDIEMRRSMYEFLRETNQEGRTIILTTHYLEEAEMMADRVGIINRGKLLMVDEKDAMMARLGRTEAHITLAQPLDTLPPAIARFPVELEADGASLCYRGGDGTGKGKAEVAELTKALIGAGIDFRGIETRESSLEDIFVSLLGEEGGAA